MRTRKRDKPPARSVDPKPGSSRPPRAAKKPFLDRGARESLHRAKTTEYARKVPRRYRKWFLAAVRGRPVRKMRSEHNAASAWDTSRGSSEAGPIHTVPVTPIDSRSGRSGAPGALRGRTRLPRKAQNRRRRVPGSPGWARGESGAEPHGLSGGPGLKPPSAQTSWTEGAKSPRALVKM